MKPTDLELKMIARKIEKHMMDIIFDIMNEFKWSAENFRIIWYDFSEASCSIQPWQPHRLLDIKCLDIQISEVESMEAELERLVEKYCEVEYFCVEMRIDEKWLYIELLVDDFS